jgi:hypothetical protein
VKLGLLAYLQIRKTRLREAQTLKGGHTVYKPLLSSWRGVKEGSDWKTV